MAFPNKFDFFNQNENKMSIVIDVSHNQGSVLWDRVAKAGVDSVFIKSTQGVNYVDPLLYHNATAAHAAGLQIGYYHFASLNNSDVVTDAKAEATFFISTIKKAVPNTLPLVLDIETNDAKIPKDKVLLFIKTFFNELSNAGYNDYLIYSYSYFFDASLPANHGLGNIRLWIADYNPPLKLPVGWSKGYLWQYSNVGVVDGIHGHVDLNKYL